MLQRLVVALCLLASSVSLTAQNPQPPTAAELSLRRQAEYAADDKKRNEITEPFWRKVSAGVMEMQRVTLKSRVDRMPFPAWVFSPLKPRGTKGHPALIWVHPDIYGYMYEYFSPYVIEAVQRGYVVVAPEYRGSIGYASPYYETLDYGGADVGDVVTAAEYAKQMPVVDPGRIGIVGWSRGGMMTLLAAEREPHVFKAVAAIVPVTNLFQRLAWKGVESYRNAIDPANHIGGTPAEKKDIYKERSPIYGIDKLEAPLLVHVTRNDTDVVIEESMQLIDALRARRPTTSETKIYEAPAGGHMFDRQCPATARTPGSKPPDPLDPASYVPTNTPEQRDSWNRLWTFLEWHLQPYR
jgi:dipeptidyl aminopeptidase/acylaminoacyl peptidase